MAPLVIAHGLEVVIYALESPRPRLGMGSRAVNAHEHAEAHGAVHVVAERGTAVGARPVGRVLQHFQQRPLLRIHFFCLFCRSVSFRSIQFNSIQFTQERLS